MTEIAGDSLASFDAECEKLATRRLDKLRALFGAVATLGTMYDERQRIQAHVALLPITTTVSSRAYNALVTDLHALSVSLDGLVQALGAEFSEVYRLGRQLGEFAERRQKLEVARASDAQRDAANAARLWSDLRSDLEYLLKNTRWLAQVNPLSGDIVDSDGKLSVIGAKLDALSVMNPSEKGQAN